MIERSTLSETPRIPRVALLGLPMALSLAFAGCSSGEGSGGSRAEYRSDTPERAVGAIENDMTERQSKNMVTVRVFDEDGELSRPVEVPKVEKPDEEWRAELTRDQYRIVRQSGTERAFTGDLLGNKNEGVYTCVGCGLPLFASNSKFESGSGWPSFFRSIADENVATEQDISLGMVRSEIHCARCEGHLGHVFDDGPAPTGLRYCVNSESIAFTDKQRLAEIAEPTASAPAGTDSAGESSEDVSAPTRATVVFAGGCFWCVEAVFEELAGVHEAISGYAGGTAETANYKDVCSGRTGHAEAVQIVFDPSVIRYEELLAVHFATHDPTTLNRQGADVGPQYRSSIFYANELEKQLSQAFLDDLAESGSFSKPVVTKLEPLTQFFPAEASHQNYVCENPGQGYVRAVALPKVEKVRKAFQDKLKEQSPLDR